MQPFHLLTFVAAAAALPIVPSGLIDARYKGAPLDVQVFDLPLAGELVAETVNSIPVDTYVRACAVCLSVL